MPVTKYATLNFSIKTENDTKHVFNDTKQVTIPACNGKVPVSWEFVPTSEGIYSVYITTSGSIDLGRQLVPFNEPRIGDGFSVSNNPNGDLTEKAVYPISPLKQFKENHDAYSVSCGSNLSLVVSKTNIPACVKDSTARKLWDRGWVNKSTEIYSKYASSDIIKHFQSKIISNQKAIKIVRDYIKENNLKLNVDTTSTGFKIVTSLNYEIPSSNYNNLLNVDPKTGIPTRIMSPWTIFYKNPQWWAELEKYYLGMEGNRIENGSLVWHVDYRECLECIAPYPIFMVDAITGKVVLTPNGVPSEIPMQEENKTSSGLELSLSIDDQYANPA